MSAELLEQSRQEETFTDMYTTHSQITQTTANDIDMQKYPLSWKSIRIYLGASMGGLLFGYDGGAIAGVLLAIRPQDLGMDVLLDYQRGLITASAALGSFSGSICAFPMADMLGRRRTLGLCSLLFIIAALVMATAVRLYTLIAGRIVLGIAVGIAAQCVPVYLSEVSPSSARGTILTLNTLAITGGQLLASILSWVILERPYAWRILFATSAIPAVTLPLLLKFIPESPRWLILVGDPQEARNSLSAIYPQATDLQILSKLAKMIQNISKIQGAGGETQPLVARGRVSHKRLSTSTEYESYLREFANRRNSEWSYPQKRYKMDPRTRRALAVGCILMFFQQATGFNAFVYFCPFMFSSIGMDDPLLPVVAVALINFSFTIFAMRVVDRVGRRSILLNSIWIMSLGLVLSSTGLENGNSSLFIIALLIYVAAYAIGMGSVPWMSVEFLPLNQRSFGASCITCTNWLTNSAISASFLPLVNAFSGQQVIVVFVVSTVINWFFVYFWYPEVKGLSLEEIGQVFEDGVDVHYVYRKYH
ncbi:LADA_0B04148g1_1 [Lachancea dasiensis]|uniref:LADA_0B04148g1_1 n=1 Tax=Lachancea dasiensis TaxID=1072105 RepID=A0A1G4ISN8_9SACH|nr:LADA_0B04148g1_1 [Lachancea dasiensis]